MKRTIGVKILGGFAAILVLMAFLSVFGIFRLNAVNDSAAAIGNRFLPGLDALVGMEADLEKQRGVLFTHIATGTAIEMTKFEKEIDDAWKQFEQLQADYEQKYATPAQREGIAEVAAAVAQYRTIQRQIIDNSRNQNKDEARRMALEEAQARFAVAEALFDRMAREERELAATATATANRTYEQGWITLSLLLAAAMVGGTVLAFYLSRRLSRDIVAVAGVARRLSEGDLGVPELPIMDTDEVGDLTKAVNHMVATLRELLQQVSTSSESVAALATQLTSTTEQMSDVTGGVAEAVGQVARGATNQSGAVAEMTRTVEGLRAAIAQIAAGAQDQARHAHQTAGTSSQMLARMEEVASKAHDVSTSTKRAVEAARRGNDVVTRSVEGMGQLQVTVTQTAGRIEALGQYTRQVGEITQMISEIADQTNLLALNAAIEAARAGEHGKGFAVVADEVRRLAERAGTSAREIADLARNIQAGTTQAVTAMAEGTKRSQESARLVGDAGRALEEILTEVERATTEAEGISESARELAQSSRSVVDAVTEVASIAQESTAATQEMAAGSDLVSRSVEEIATISEENAATAEEVSASTEQLHAAADQVAASAQQLAEVALGLRSQVSRFRA